jgi:hypothetical protein
MNNAVHLAHAAPRARRHDLQLAMLLAGAAVALILVVFLSRAPLTLRWPPASDPALRVEGLRSLRILELIEGGLLGVLAFVVAFRGEWLRRQNGLALLDRRPLIVLGLLALVHLGSMFFWFPVRDILSADPATSCDNAYHYYQIYAAHQFMNDGHHLWGYNPYFMAGFPAGVVFDLDMKGAELYCHVLAGIGLPLAFKSYIVLSFVLFPFALYAAGRLLGFRGGEALVAVLLGLLFWHWGRPLLGHFRWAGMHSYVLASYLSLLALALFVHFVDKSERPSTRPAWGTWLVLVALVALACQVHPLSILLLAPGFATLYLVAFRSLSRRAHLMLWFGFALALAANADWIVPFLRFRHYKTASDYWFQLRGMKDIAFVYSRETSILFTLITVLGVTGLVRMWRHRRHVALSFGVTALCLFVAAFYGARIQPLANTEPGRYLVPFAFFLILPATSLLVPLLERLQGRIGRPMMAVGIALTAALAPVLSLADNLFFDAHRMRAAVDPRFVALMADLRQHTTADARILFETPGGFYNSSDLLYGGHLQALVPIYTNREVIGGPYPVNFMVHAAIDFKNGLLLDRPLRDWSEADVRHFVDTYNVGWVVCWSATSRATFDALPELAHVQGDFDRFRVYEIDRPHSFVLLGGGQARAGYNRIEVDGAAGDEVVLKYHWLESLRAEPPVPLSREPVPGDPIGFIKLRPQGYSHIVIRNEY